MTETDGNAGLYTSAILFGMLTVFCMAVTVICILQSRQDGFSAIMAILVLLFGNLTFTCLEKPSVPSVPLQEFHESDTFVSKLKNGAEVIFLIQIKFFASEPSPSTMEQIKYRILRRLNENITTLDALYEHPLTTTDTLVGKDIPDLCKELNLQNLTLRALEVGNGNAQTNHHSQGIYFGDRR